MARLVRTTYDSILFGVCGGIAKYFDVDVTWIRLGFALAAIFSFGSPILIYIILIFVMPKDY